MAADRECKWMCDPLCPLCEGEAYLGEVEAATAEALQEGDW